jgi:hypothetical protein
MLGTRLVRVIAGALGLLGVTLAQVNLPNAAYWEAHGTLLYIAVILLMVTVVHELFSFVSYFRHLGKIRNFDRNIRAILSATISQIEKATGAQWQSIGVSSYCIRGAPWRQALLLVEDLRLGGGVTRQFPRWRPDKGLIGRSYVDEDVVCEDWQKFFKESMALGRDAWLGRTEKERYGLTWGELMRTGQLVWIAACPVYSEAGKAIGVVAVDAPMDLSVAAVEPVLREVGAALGDVGKPPGSWWSYVVRRND